MPFIIVGTGVQYSALKEGVFECPRCGVERVYLRKQGKRYFTLFFIPLVPVEDVDEIVECQACRGRFRPVVLVKKGDASAVDAFMESLRDKDYKVRQSATDALARIGKPAVKPLLAALADSDWKLRREAADALGKLGDPRAVEPLILALRDEDFSVKTAAAYALGLIGDPRAIDPLIEALNDRDLQMVAGEALAQIKNQISLQETE
jgi:HEAT repeat protein